MTLNQFLVFVGAGVLSFTFVLNRTGLWAMDAVAIGVATGVGAACLAVNLWNRRPVAERRYLSLGAVFLGYYAISYGFSVLGSEPSFSGRIFPTGLDGLDLSALPLGVLAWLVGYRFLYLAPISDLGRRYFLPARTTGPVGPATLMAAYGLTVLPRVLLVASGSGYGYLRNAEGATRSVSSSLQYVAEIGGFGVVLMGLAVVASVHASSERQSYTWCYRVMLGGELVLGLLAGQKSEFLIVVVMFSFAKLAVGVRIPARRLVALGVVSLLLIFPLVGSYRDVLRPDVGRQLSASEAPGALITALTNTASTFADGPVPYAQLAFDSTVGRFREIDRAAVSIKAHDAGRPYSAPSEMATRVATGLIPRVLWPDKPINLYALQVTREYYGVSTDVISASSLSPVGDAYRYGGLSMVALVLALLGGYVRHLDEALAARHSIWLVPLLIAAIPLLRSGDLAGLLVGTVRYYLIVGLLYRLVFLRASARPGRAASRDGRSARAGQTT